ncbi:fatty acid synthase-like [Achroia grisella]|uniref:fatty acid synthase-like n=1 Tax=Achroia grisella TaxID=688607 RepID=UPI0027D22887|nr:fatty acid synthase-like [Achroia grisella]
MRSSDDARNVNTRRGACLDESAATIESAFSPTTDAVTPRADVVPRPAPPARTPRAPAPLQVEAAPAKSAVLLKRQDFATVAAKKPTAQRNEPKVTLKMTPMCTKSANRDDDGFVTMSSNNKDFSSGYRLSHPPTGEEVYITGISGSFPDSASVIELQENLFNKVDMISDDDRRWEYANTDVPHCSGKINKLNKFDASFFKVNYKEAHAMDPMARILLEKAYEAIFDAGMNPKELENTKTGVFIGVCVSEAQTSLLYNRMHVNNYGVIGSSKAMFAHRISRWLKVQGPAYNMDSACSSSFYALDHAFAAIRNGQCHAAIVGGSNLCLHPHMMHQIARIGLLSPDSRCKSFDNSANGYVRSEAVTVCFLQKARDSRRVHAQLVHVKTNCDGFKDNGIMYPAAEGQNILLREFYEECSIVPSTLEYVEAHSGGTRVGDLEEAITIDEIFCTGRTEPIYAGSIKSNIGHTESVSGICSIAKICIAYNTGFIPPNLHFKTPREDIPSFVNGRIRIVTEKQPWNRGLVGIKNTGFGGANAHALLKNVAREKVNNGLPEDDLPRLVCVSGRTESSVARILDHLQYKPVDVDEIKLLHAVHNKDIHSHKYRGFVLLGSTPTKSILLSRSIQEFNGNKRPICFVYSDVSSKWKVMMQQLLRIPIFSAAIERCHNALVPKGINFKNIITELNTAAYNILNSFIRVTAFQIGLTDVLKAIGVEPDFVIGFGVGELGCAYTDGCLTAEETILAAYSQGLALTEANLIKGSMAAIGIGYEMINPTCPDDIDVVYRINPNYSVVSGPSNIITNFIEEVSAQKLYAKEICCDIAYHSRYIAHAGPNLRKYLNKVIRSPKTRSKRWISTSTPESQWNNINSKYSSAEYHSNSILNPVFIENYSHLIQEDAIFIEMVPHDILQVISQQSLNNNIDHISLSKNNTDDNVQVLFTALGKLYETGLNLQLANIYPHVPLPVSQGTPFLSHLVEWDHSEDWYVTKFDIQEKINVGERIVRMSINYSNDDYMAGYVVNDRNVYPEAGYLFLVWETLSMMIGRLYTQVSVVFENVCFHRDTEIPKKGKLEFIISIQKGSGQFEIVESGTSVVTGLIRKQEDVEKKYLKLPALIETSETDKHIMNTKDFYKEMKLRGYQYRGLFRGVIETNVDKTHARLVWDKNWITYLDSVLQLQLFSQDTRNLYVVKRIEELSIDVQEHYSILSTNNPHIQRQSLDGRLYSFLNIIRSGGVEIRGLHTASVPRQAVIDVPVLDRYVFVSNFGRIEMKLDDCLRAYMQIIIENIQAYKFKVVETVDKEYKDYILKPIIGHIGKVLNKLVFVQAELLLISKEKIETPEKTITVIDDLKGLNNVVLFVGANLLNRPPVLTSAVATLRAKSFIISREMKYPNVKEHLEFDIIAVQSIGKEYLVLLRQREVSRTTKFIKIGNVNDETFPWIKRVQQEVKIAKKVVLYTQYEEVNGLLGLVNCLRKEQSGDIISCLMISDPMAPKFNPNLEFYKEQLDKNLAVNVYQNGQWGTYRHLLLEDTTVAVDHAFVHTFSIGNLSSMAWVEGALKKDKFSKNINNVLLQVYCTAINLHDVLTATGRNSNVTASYNRVTKECKPVRDVVGRTSNGSRVMSIAKNSAITNMVECNKLITWSVPEEWTFEEAATVPVAYATAYYALVIVGQIKRSDSVLIHDGTSGVGQATINIALSYGCEVFTTVGSSEKETFLKRLFPQLKDTHIGNSKNTSFENLICKETNGKGVNIVMNSLKGDKLQASIKCLGYRGRFLEIGNFNSNTSINMYLPKETSFHGITLDFALHESIDLKTRLQELILSGIEIRAVRPLTYCIFEKDEIESAFHYLADNKQIGQIIIKIRDEELTNQPVQPKYSPIDAIPRYWCREDQVQIIVGGLGGIGLELADWFISRGARKILLISRRGISNGYQFYRIRVWTTNGVDVRISTHDITTESGCEEMLKMANTMGTVESIFNLAVVLKDSIFQNQTPETFKISFRPKGLATMHLDKLSRKLCPTLKYFVLFSSLSCGHGNTGQTNYGYSNSVMERICEIRRKVGLPALTIQWCAIADVGVLAEMQQDDKKLEVGGILQQSIASCLLHLDKMLKQDNTIVSSMVVPKKQAVETEIRTVTTAVSQIIGIKNMQTMSRQIPLAELGIDSMTALNIKNTLEFEFEIFLAVQEIRSMSFTRLDKISEALSNDINKTGVNTEPVIKNGVEKMVEKDANGIKREKENHNEMDIMFVLPGLDANSTMKLSRRLKIKVCVLKLENGEHNENWEQIVDVLYQLAISHLTSGANFWLLGYSFGTLLALKLAWKLENRGHKGTIFCLDGIPNFLFELASQKYISDDFKLQNTIICKSIDFFAPSNGITEALIENLNDIEDFNKRIQYSINTTYLQAAYSKQYIASTAQLGFEYVKVIFNNTTKIKKLDSPIVLIKTKENPLSVSKEKFGLGKFSDRVNVHILDENVSVTENEDVVNIINKVIYNKEEWMKKDIGRI